MAQHTALTGLANSTSAPSSVVLDGVGRQTVYFAAGRHVCCRWTSTGMTVGNGRPISWCWNLRTEPLSVSATSLFPRYALEGAELRRMAHPIRITRP